MNNKKGPEKFWKMILALIIGYSFILFSCVPSAESTLPGKIKRTITTNDSNLLEQQASQQSNDSPVVELLGERLQISDYFLDIPKDWYSFEVNQTNVTGWIFTSQDPQLTQENGFNEWAGALWVVTPLPSGASPEEFRSNLQNQVYKNSDLEAMLIVPEKTGLLDLSEAEILLSAVQITAWANQPCLEMKGTITFGDSSNLTLDTILYLMVHDQNFLTFYQFSDHVITEQVAPALIASRESLRYTQ